MNFRKILVTIIVLIFLLGSIPNNWPTTFIRPSKIRKLTVTTSNGIGNFFEYFENLSSVTIMMMVDAVWWNKEFAMAFDIIGSSLEYLNIICIFKTIGPQSIAALIREKLPNLKRLAFAGILSENAMSIIELPCLKVLDIWYHKSINALMKTLI